MHMNKNEHQRGEMSANSRKQVFFISSEETFRGENTEKCWLRQNQLSLQDFMLAVHVSVNHRHTHDVHLRTKHSTFTIYANQPNFTSVGGVINRAAKPADVSKNIWGHFHP